MKKLNELILSLIFLCSVYLLNSCATDCNHTYSLTESKDSTCTEEGYTEFECTECGETYREPIQKKGHTPSEAPTLDASQVCTVCGLVLAGTVDYVEFRENDLIINGYYGYGNSYIDTKITTQNLNRYTPDPIQYIDKNGAAYPLNLSIPIQDFFTHNVSSVLPLSTQDGKTYITDSGFKVLFNFNTMDKSVDTIHAWDYGLSSELKKTDKEYLKLVGEYQANPSYYNKVYELIDFSDCYIEIAKKTETGYKTLKKIDSEKDWKAILQNGFIEISNDNGSLFYDAGTYRILFKYNMTWITDPPSAVYDTNDTGKSNPIYPYGKINDQYEFFYITVTEERKNVLLPANAETFNSGFFAQIRAHDIEKSSPFISNHSSLFFKDNISFKIGAKVDMTKDGYFYNKQTIKSFSLSLSVYNSKTDSYDVYKTCDLMPSITRDVVFGEEILVDIEKDASLRDKKFKITISYSFLDEATGKTTSEQQDYYYTFVW